MSKGRVWNKGKRNGGGGPPESSKSKLPASTAAGNSSPKKVATVPVVNDGGIKDNPVNVVKRMNRENWVERPARVINKEPKK